MGRWRYLRTTSLGTTGCAPWRWGRSFGHSLALALLSLFGGLLFAAAPLAAPITGETEIGSPNLPAEDLTGPALQDPAAAPSVTTSAGDRNSTVIEFSVVPSLSDPSKMETVIVVQQRGGKKICVNLNNSDIVSRSYRPRGDEPFDPPVPTELRGLTTGNRGELVGFNDSKVFIKPNSPQDDFKDSNECFTAADIEACFVASNEDCDQSLAEGDFVCVGDGISSSGCPILDHANLTRQLRIMLALNNPLGEAPIITAADIARAPEFESPGGQAGAPGGGLPGGPGGGGPTFGGSFSGSGGGGQIIVPNVVGMPVPAAVSVMTNAGFVVGTVKLRIEVASLIFPLIKSAYAAQIVCPSEEPNCNASDFTVDSQTPPPHPCPAGSLQDVGTECDLSAVTQQSAAIPEPGTLPLFAIGLLLLGLITWRHRGGNR